MKQHLRIQRTAAIFLLAALVLATFSAPASAQITLFDKYYAVPNPGKLPDCSKANPCSLQAAVNKAGDGDTIYVKGGSVPYTSTVSQVVNINKSVEIIGGWDGSPLGRFDHVDPVAYPTVLDGEGARRVILIEGDASPTLSGISIYRGYVDAGEGGGVAITNLTGGDVLIDKCWIKNNTAGWYGGGISIHKGSLTILNSAITANSTAYGGGAILAGIDTTVMMENNIIMANDADYGSVGHFDRANLTAKSNVIYQNAGNPAVSFINELGQSLVFENNLFRENNGAAVSGTTTDGSSITFLHNTLVNNQGMGLLVPNNTTGTIANNIFQGQKYESLYLGTSSTATVSHNLFWQNDSDPTLGTNPVQADPLLDSNFRLTYGSPAINAGTASAVLVDRDGQLRPLGLPDIGADEFSLPLYLPATMR